MTLYEKRIDSAISNAITRLEKLANKEEKKGNLARAEELRQRAEYLISQQ